MEKSEILEMLVQLAPMENRGNRVNKEMSENQAYRENLAWKSQGLWVNREKRVLRVNKVG